MENGSELIAHITNDWSQMYAITFKYIQSGKPTKQAFIERFDGSYRLRALNISIFKDLNQVLEQTQIWMDDDDPKRPHDSLNKIPPVKYAKLNFCGANPLGIKNKILKKQAVLIKGNLHYL